MLDALAQDAINRVQNQLNLVEKGQFDAIADETFDRKRPKLKVVKRNPYFRRGRDTKKVDEYDEGESGSEFPVKFK